MKAIFAPIILSLLGVALAAPALNQGDDLRRAIPIFGDKDIDALLEEYMTTSLLKKREEDGPRRPVIVFGDKDIDALLEEYATASLLQKRQSDDDNGDDAAPRTFEDAVIDWYNKNKNKKLGPVQKRNDNIAKIYGYADLSTYYKDLVEATEAVGEGAVEVGKAVAKLANRPNGRD